jgi:hypothetical protein
MYWKSCRGTRYGLFVHTAGQINALSPDISTVVEIFIKQANHNHEPWFAISETRSDKLYFSCDTFNVYSIGYIKYLCLG